MYEWQIPCCKIMWPVQFVFLLFYYFLLIDCGQYLTSFMGTYSNAGEDMFVTTEGTAAAPDTAEKQHGRTYKLLSSRYLVQLSSVC